MTPKRVFTQEFKEDAVQYRKDHPELNLQKVASNLAVSIFALRKWSTHADKCNGTVETRGYRNYASEEAKEIARLKRELHDKEDVLEIFKKAISILGN